MNPAIGADTAEKRLMNRATAQRIPINGSIEVSPLCNMNCDMCFVRLSREEMAAQGRLRTAAEWLDIGRQMRDAGVLFLLLTGGEPLLYPDFKELYLGLRQMGMILTVNTNGTLLDEEWAEFFAKNPPRRINLTLYGADDRAYQNLCHHSGGFHQAMTAIQLLKEREIPFRLSYSLTRENAQDVKKVLALSRELELHCGIDPYMMPATRERSRPYAWDSRLTPEEAARYAHELHRAFYSNAFGDYCRSQIEAIDAAARYAAEHPEAKRPLRSACLAGQCSFSINWQGHLLPCLMLTAPGADVFEASFAQAWQQVAEGMEHLLLHEDCAVCPRRSLCDICPAAALYETGSHGGKPDYLCRYSAEKERLMRAEVLMR